MIRLGQIASHEAAMADIAKVNIETEDSDEHAHDDEGLRHAAVKD